MSPLKWSVKKLTIYRGKFLSRLPTLQTAIPITAKSGGFNRFLEDDVPGVVPPTVVGIVLPFSATFQLVGAVTGLDHQFVGDRRHK
jgi:hypothetical protein